MHKTTRLIGMVMVGVMGVISLICIFESSNVMALETVSIILDDNREHSFNPGEIVYEGISEITTNSTELQGIESGNGDIRISVAEDEISADFPIKVQDKINSNKMNIEVLDLKMDVNSIETLDSGDTKIYSASVRSSSDHSIGDKNIQEAILEQSDNGDKAKLILLLY